MVQDMGARGDWTTLTIATSTLSIHDNINIIQSTRITAAYA